MTKKYTAVSILALGLCFGARKSYERLDDAADVLNEIMATPDKGIPEDLLNKSACVIVVPGLKKGAFIVGADYGQGVATCRTAKGWSAPVFVQITGGSFGLQAGGQSTELVLVGVSTNSMDLLLHDKLKLGGDAAASAGPVGRALGRAAAAGTRSRIPAISWTA